MPLCVLLWRGAEAQIKKKSLPILGVIYESLEVAQRSDSPDYS